jgi:hypothetical protein
MNSKIPEQASFRGHFTQEIKCATGNTESNHVKLTQNESKTPLGESTENAIKSIYRIPSVGALGMEAEVHHVADKPIRTLHDLGERHREANVD